VIGKALRERGSIEFINLKIDLNKIFKISNSSRLWSNSSWNANFKNNNFKESNLNNTSGDIFKNKYGGSTDHLENSFGLSYGFRNRNSLLKFYLFNLLNLAKSLLGILKIYLLNNSKITL
jgi:hypothetical protein